MSLMFLLKYNNLNNSISSRFSFRKFNRFETNKASEKYLPVLLITAIHKNHITNDKHGG